MYVFEFKIPDDKGAYTVSGTIRDELKRLAIFLQDMGEDYKVGTGKEQMLEFAEKLNQVAESRY